MPQGSKYSLNEVYTICKSVAQGQVPEAELGARCVAATAVVWKESRGDARKLNANDNGQGPSRGWWQFLEKYWNANSNPPVPDSVAYDPVASTKAAFIVSKKFTDFSPWSSGEDGRTLGDEFREQGDDLIKEVASIVDIAKGAGDEVDQLALMRLYGSNLLADGIGIGGGGPVGDFFSGVADGISGTVGGVVGAVTGWAGALTRLLSNLINPEFWKRLGIGALGGILIVIALILLFKDSLTDLNPMKAANSE